MLNLAPWYYRELLGDNELINVPEFFKVKLINNHQVYESVVSLKSKFRPSWINSSKIYRNCDGSGAANFKNIAVYKAISEALERLAFYEKMESSKEEYCLNLNPTTTGLAAFPYFNHSKARVNAKAEAVERWAIHEFNKSKIPVKKHFVDIDNLLHYELITPFNEIKVSILAYKTEHYYAFGFAAGVNLKHSLNRSYIELDRNIRVLNQSYLNKKNEIIEFESAVDKTLIYFSKEEGFHYFCELVNSSPQSIFNSNPKVICDKSLDGGWNKYTKVWRYLLEDSYFPYHEDHTFFMF